VVLYDSMQNINLDAMCRMIQALADKLVPYLLQQMLQVMMNGFKSNCVISKSVFL